MVVNSKHYRGTIVHWRKMQASKYRVYTQQGKYTLLREGIWPKVWVLWQQLRSVDCVLTN